MSSRIQQLERVLDEKAAQIGQLRAELASRDKQIAVLGAQMPNQRDPNQVAITVYVPRDLKAAAKARAEEKGETVTDVVVRALRRYVR